MRSSILSPAVLCAAIAPACPSFGQALTEAPLGQITLTASGSALELSRTGASVTVLTEETLKRAGNGALANQLARLPGVSMSRNGGLGTSTALRIRGLGPAYIGVRIDGIDVADPSGTQCNYDFGATTSANISRIEVLRGSQSALYGSEAIGGVVDITSFRAEEEGVEARISLEGGSDGTWSGAASLGVKDERGELSFSLSRTVSDGISAYAYGRENDPFRATMVSFYGAYALTPNLTLGANGFARDSFSAFDSQTADSAETEEGRLRGGRAFLQADWGQSRHEFALARTTTARDYPLGWVKTYEGERDQFSWKGNWADAGPWAFNWGLDHNKESFAAGSDRGDVRSAALYGEALWTVSPALDLSFALRRDDHETFGGQSSGRMAAAWRPSEDWVLRAVASTGFRAPSLYELYSAYGNPSLEPETSRSFELGAEYLISPEASLQATLFDTEIDNKISFARNRYEQVLGTTRTRGVEVIGSYAVSAQLSVFGNYTYTDAYAENAGGRTAALRVPRHDLALGLEAALSPNLTAQASVHHVADFSDSGLWPAPASKMPDYTLVNASLSYALGEDLEAWLRVENLFDEEYQTVRNYGQAGRQIFLGMSRKF